MRTARLFDARHPAQELGHRLDDFGLWWRHIERGTSSGQPALLSGRDKQTVMPDTLEPGGQDMVQKAPNELGPGRWIVRLPVDRSARTRKDTSLSSIPTIRSFEIATRCV
nr:hypothetical protein [Propionivibrio sp.]